MYKVNMVTISNGKLSLIIYLSLTLCESNHIFNHVSVFEIIIYDI